MDQDQPTSFALLIVVGLEEGKSLCGVNVSWSDHLSLATELNKFGNTTKFYRTLNFSPDKYRDLPFKDQALLWQAEIPV